MWAEAITSRCVVGAHDVYFVARVQRALTFIDWRYRLIVIDWLIRGRHCIRSGIVYETMHHAIVKEAACRDRLRIGL